MTWALGFASVAAILAWCRPGSAFGFVFGFTEPKIVLMGLGVLVAWYFRNARDIPKRVKLPVMIYAVCFLPLVPFSRDFDTSMLGVRGMMSGSVLTASLCASGLILASKVENSGPIRKAILCAGAFTAIHGFMQASGADPFGMSPLPDGNKAISTIGSHVDLGALMVLLFTIQRNPLYLIGIWSTHSRGAWLGTAVALVPRRFRMAAFVAATVVGMCGSFHNTTRGEISRHEVWRVALDSASLKGSGPCTFVYTFLEGRSKKFVEEYPTYMQTHAHNAILEAFSTKGVLGLVSLVAFLFFPSMAGLWTVSMFNPISFEVVFLACVLVGLDKEEENAWRVL